MSDRYLQWVYPGEVPDYEKVELVGITDMTDLSDGWYTVSNVYAPDLPEESYRVAIVRIEDE